MPGLVSVSDAAWDSVAGGLDWAAGSVDESVGRQFDDEPGGGFADMGVDVVQGTVDTGAETIGGSLGYVFGGTADYLDDVGDAAGGAVADQAQETGGAVEGAGDYTGGLVLGVTDTVAGAAEDAGQGVGNFWSGALNTQTLALLVVGIAALYVLANSDAGEAAGGAAGASATGGMT